jgi:hypothetical protein
MHVVDVSVVQNRITAAIVQGFFEISLDRCFKLEIEHYECSVHPDLTVNVFGLEDRPI